MRSNEDYTNTEVWWERYGPEYSARSWRDYRHLLAEAVLYAERGPLLDIGCGLGFLVECARHFGISSLGLEGSDSALARGRALHPEADLRSWRAGTPLELDSDSVGVAVLNEVVDHLTLDQNRALFNEIKRVLTPSGVLLVKSPSRFNRYDQDLGHVTFFSPVEFRAFVESFGLSIVTQPFTPQPFLGRSPLAGLIVRAAAKILPRERLAARIDLVARR